MQKVLEFLRALELHNDREWFHAHKPLYEDAKSRWGAFCEQLIAEVGRFDPDIAPLTLADCTYRIHRDTRFSHDKSPYKTHFGLFLSKGGKKSMHAGYYFHVGTGRSPHYPQAHLLAAGNYCYDRRAVLLLREDISGEWDHFRRQVLGKADSRFVAAPGADMLKRVPRPYDASAPYADWMRMKSYCLSAPVDDAFLLAPHLVQRVSGMFRTVQPFVRYVNRAVDFAADES